MTKINENLSAMKKNDLSNSDFLSYEVCMEYSSVGRTMKAHHISLLPSCHGSRDKDRFSGSDVSTNVASVCLHLDLTTDGRHQRMVDSSFRRC